MFLSIFELFKPGPGPSSSHTMGPMVAAGRFLALVARRQPGPAARLAVTLHGSLAFTGKGHATDTAVSLGLLGQRPDRVDPDRVAGLLAGLAARGTLDLEGAGPVAFQPDRDILFDYGPALPGHANGLVFRLHDAGDRPLLEETYYSVGGGFVRDQAEQTAFLAAAESGDDRAGDRPPVPFPPVPFPFDSGATMLEMSARSRLSIAEMKRRNELTRLSPAALDAGLDDIWSAMRQCMDRGLARRGRLPGGLKVERRAASIFSRLQAAQRDNAMQPHRAMDWLSVYAMAVNEENAAGGRVVTAPTNGAAGVIPAVMRYGLEQALDPEPGASRVFLLVAGAIGGLIKHNASISGAEVGCQGEVGSAAAMAAAGLCAVMGGHSAQIENAAEIALEHHLGMTCDPVAGLVQVPCIERNALGAVKAVTAASLALHGDGTHLVSLDACVRTMRATGADMRDAYKETATGGLAVNVVAC